MQAKINTVGNLRNLKSNNVSENGMDLVKPTFKPQVIKVTAENVYVAVGFMDWLISLWLKVDQASLVFVFFICEIVNSKHFNAWWKQKHSWHSCKMFKLHAPSYPFKNVLSVFFELCRMYTLLLVNAQILMGFHSSACLKTFKVINNTILKPKFN